MNHFSTFGTFGTSNKFRTLACTLFIGLAQFLISSASLATPPNTSTGMTPIPPNVGMTGINKPMMMLTASKDHTLFAPMYTDFEDLDGDGTIDTTFLPTFKYYGYFDATKCYTYASGQFEPDVNATITTSNEKKKYSCGGSGQWSGNFLNWATMTRLDVMRKMLYGGQRSTDSTTNTVLQIARLSWDAHSFVKYYNGDDIRDYTPFSKADLTKTTGSNPNVYSGLTMCVQSEKDGNGMDVTPQIRLAKGNYRMWAVMESIVCDFWPKGTNRSFNFPQPANGYSTFGPKLSRYYGTDKTYYGGKTPIHEVDLPDQTQDGATYGNIGPILTARVKVCVPEKIGDERCQAYTNGKSITYKPIGLLQLYGTSQSGTTSARAEFGLITGSYDKNLTAGALRKNIRDLNDEINPTTGQFCFSGKSICSGTLTDGRDYISNGAIYALDRIVLYGRPSNSNRTNNGIPAGQNYGDGVSGSGMTEGNLAAWGNPIGEMVIQALEYYSGLSSTNPETTTKDQSLSMPVAAWEDPLSDSNATRKSAYGKGVCRPLNLLAISSSALSFDGNTSDASTEFAKLPNRSRGGLDAFTNVVGETEGFSGTKRSVGSATGGWGEECSAKEVKNLADVSGICPVAPALGGTYKVAGAALYARTNKVRDASLPTDAPGAALKVKTYAAAMAGGVARVEVKIPSTDPLKKEPQYVYITPESLWGTSMPGGMLTFNSISASATHGAFVVTWNDVLHGGDHDLDMSGYLRFDLLNNNTQIKITTDILTVAGGGSGAHGFSIIGTDKDGRYLTHYHGGAQWDGKELAPGKRTPGDNSIAGYLCGIAAYRKATDLSSVEIPQNGVFPGIPKGRMEKQSGINACDTSFGILKVRNQDAPVSITFNVVPANNVTLDDPLLYAAKYGSFELDKDQESDNKELPNTFKKWDTENNDGSLCSSTSGCDKIPDGYFFARRPDLLEKRLEKLFRKLTSTSNAAPAVSSAQITTGGYAFSSTFSYDHRWGTVKAYKLKSDGTFENTPTWDGSLTLGSAAQNPDTRSIMTNLGVTGIKFTESDLGTSGVSALKSTGTDDEAKQLIAYLRGDGSKEASPSNINGIWRYRAKDTAVTTNSSDNPRYLMGTVVNSSPWLQAPPSGRFTWETGYREFIAEKKKRTNVLWLGSNDGMLHAFKASGSSGLGTPLLSYIPSPLLGRMRSLSLASSTGITAGMDGSPYTADVKVGTGTSSAWKTYLFSSLGRGGRAFFALDVTDTSESGLHANNAASIFKWMFSSDDDADLGYVLADPRNHPDSDQTSHVLKMQNGKYAVLVPNGVNSGNSNHKAYLYILFVDGPSSNGTWTDKTHYVKLKTDDVTGNGLMGATWADTNRDGMADVVYATDRLGRLWKFDVSSNSPSTWASRDPILLFEAKDGTNSVPVMTAPAIAFSSTGGQMVLFGTGQSIYDGDFPKQELTQRFYGIYDKYDITDVNNRGRTSAVESDRSTLMRRVAKRTADGRTYIETASEISGEVVSSNFNAGKYKGWYIDFPPLKSGSTANNEMLLSPPEVAVGNLFFSTVRPAPDLDNVCFSTPPTSLWALDPIVGTPKVTYQGTVTINGKVVNVIASDSGSAQKRTIGIMVINGKRTVVGLGVKDDGIDALNTGNATPARSQWREIPNIRTLD
jgi:type IV pilus assembly protein PilY1